MYPKINFIFSILICFTCLTSEPNEEKKTNSFLTFKNENGTETKIYEQNNLIGEYSNDKKNSNGTKSAYGDTLISSKGLIKIWSLASGTNSNSKNISTRFKFKTTNIYSFDERGEKLIALNSAVILNFHSNITDSEIDSFIQNNSLTLIRKLGNTILVKSETEKASIDLANSLSSKKEINYAIPDMIQLNSVSK